jgi:hypothetical protein
MGILEELAVRLERAVIEGQEAFDKAHATGNPDDVARLYIRVKDEYERLDEARKAMLAVIERTSRHVIPEMMLERKIRTITLDDIKRRVGVSTRINCAIIPEKKAEAFDWLRDPQQQAAELIQETVNSGTLSSFARQRVEDLGLEMPDDKFKMSSMQLTSVTKVK